MDIISFSSVPQNEEILNLSAHIYRGIDANIQTGYGRFQRVVIDDQGLLDNALSSVISPAFETMEFQNRFKSAHSITQSVQQSSLPAVVFKDNNWNSTTQQSALHRVITAQIMCLATVYNGSFAEKYDVIALCGQNVRYVGGEWHQDFVGQERGRNCTAALMSIGVYNGDPDHIKRHKTAVRSIEENGYQTAEKASHILHVGEQIVFKEDKDIEHARFNVTGYGDDFAYQANAELRQVYNTALLLRERVA